MSYALLYRKGYWMALMPSNPVFTKRKAGSLIESRNPTVVFVNLIRLDRSLGCVHGE